MDPFEEETATSIAERAAEEAELAASEAEFDEEFDGQTFLPLDGDKPLTLAGLAPRSMPVESQVSIMSGSTEAKGMLDANRRGTLLVSYQLRKYEYVPHRNGNGDVEKYVLRQVVKPVFVQPASGQLAIETVILEAVAAGMGLDEVRDIVHAALAGVANT